MPMLSIEAVADRLGVARNTVRTWCRTGELPAVQLGGKIWRVESADLEAWILRQRPTTTPEQPADERQAELELHADPTLQHVLA